MKNYRIDYVNKTVELTKKFAKSAGVLNTPEYKELVNIRRDNPDFDVVIREIKRKAGKQTYKHLTIDAMRGYIADWMGEESEELTAFEKVVALSKVQRDPYAYVKRWFLANYKDRLEEYTPATEENEEA